MHCWAGGPPCLGRAQLASFRSIFEIAFFFIITRSFSQDGFCGPSFCFKCGMIGRSGGINEFKTDVGLFILLRVTSLMFRQSKVDRRL